MLLQGTQLIISKYLCLKQTYSNNLNLNLLVDTPGVY